MDKPDTFEQAVLEAYEDGCKSEKSPRGMSATDIRRHMFDLWGKDAWPLCTVIDVADVMQDNFGAPNIKATER
jgi:hypothetical protein